MHREENVSHKKEEIFGKQKTMQFMVVNMKISKENDSLICVKVSHVLSFILQTENK